MLHTSAWALFRSRATSLSKSSSFISVSKRSAPPSSKSFDSCCFDSISLSIFSSTVPRQTNLCTKTFLVWPMRKARSVAWFSTAGFHQRSKCTTCEAAVRLSPEPPALSESTKKPILSSSWNRRTSSLRFLTSVSPSRTSPGRPNTDPRNASSGRVSSRNCVNTKPFSCLAAMADGLPFRFIRQTGDDRFVGLPPTQNIMPHYLAQGAVGIVRLRGQALGKTCKFLGRTEQAEIQEIEDRPKIAQTVLDGGAGEGKPHACLELLHRLGLLGRGIFDGLRFVEHDEIPGDVGDPGKAQQRAVTRDHNVHLPQFFRRHSF